MWAQFTAAYEETVYCFQRACETLLGNDITEMKYARVRMRGLAGAFAEAIGYEEELPWDYSPPEWYRGPYNNEYQVDWR